MAPETCFITQGQIYEWYAQIYSDRIAALIIALSLDDAFHSWWFAPITAFLCVNLLMCSVLRFPQIRRNWLGFHVSTAIIAYGAFGLSFVLAVIFLLRDRTTAFFAAFGFICVLFTYIGVNTFLPGVHSYA